MTDLAELGQAIRHRRAELGLTREQLSSLARVSRARIEALENGRAVEMGFQNLMQILNALGLDLRLTELNRQRPTLEDLQRENARK